MCSDVFEQQTSEYWIKRRYRRVHLRNYHGHNIDIISGRKLKCTKRDSFFL
jgi:hypothetical protein